MAQKEYAAAFKRAKREPFAKVPFTVNGHKVTVGKKTYGIRQLYVLSGILRFCSLTLIVMGIMRYLVFGWVGVVYVVGGLLTYGIGYLYKKISREAKQKANESACDIAEDGEL